MADVAQIGRQYGGKHYDSNSRWPKRHPVRLTALFALKEALRLERYEDCRDIIAIAKEFGASDWEIYYLLEDSRRSP